MTRAFAGAALVWALCGCSDPGEAWVALPPGEQLREVGSCALESTDEPERVISVHADFHYTMALTNHGRVWLWGLNKWPGVAAHYALEQSFPEPVESPYLRCVRKLSISGYNNCALLESGAVVCWGSGGLGAGNPDAGGPIPTKVIGLNQPAVDIASGASFSAAILEDGQSVLWGRIHQWPVSLSIASPIWPYPGIPMAAHLPVDSSPDCYATAERELYCMLTESPDGEPALHPAPMPGPDDVVELATSWETSCARTSGGDVYCWGSGPVGDGSTEGASAPVHVPGIVGATQIAARGHNAAVLADGTAVCWGVYGLSTACGEPVIPYMEGPLLEPRPIAGLPPVTQVSAGIGHTCALTAEGEVYCLGLNTSDQLGDGTYSTTAVPVKVKLPSHLGG